MSEFYGIDLGTTYSCIATINDDNIVTVIPNNKGQMTTPSVVYIDEKGKIMVGKSAKSKLGSDPANAVAFIKREMSTPGFTRRLQGKDYTPSEISSMILKHLVEFANEKRKNEEGKDPIFDVVITVPAYFGDVERERTKEAGRLAGLNVLRLINEPTAASLSYGRKQNDNKTLLVYDLGGGTFDVTIIQFKNNVANVLSSRGNHKLGGADWDRAIVDIVLDKEGIRWDDLSKAEQGMIMNAAEDAKIGLTDDEEFTLQFSYKGIHNVDITRSEFEERTSDLMIQTQMLVEEALDAAQMSALDIDEVILVGGSSRMPMVDTLANELFPRCDVKLVDPDQAVAKGAALVAAMDSSDNQVGGLRLGTDKGSRAYGLAAYNSNDQLMINNLIMLNDDQEITVTKTNFSTRADNQTSVGLQFYRSTSEQEWMDVDPALEIKAKDGNNSVSWGKPVPKGTPVTVIVERDKSGIVTFKVSCCGATGTFVMESADSICR